MRLQRTCPTRLSPLLATADVDGRELSPEELQRRGVSTYAGWRLAGSYFLVRGQGSGSGSGYVWGWGYGQG